MGKLLQRKTTMIMALALSLAVTLIMLATDSNLRERLGTMYWLLGLAIIGCVLLVLAGYVWDRTLMERLRQINQTARKENERNVETSFSDIDLDDDPVPDQDEIIGLARQIERMAQSLQKVEASYRGIVEDQVDLICRYRADGSLTFVNAAYAKFLGRKRKELIGQKFALVEQGYPKRDFQGNMPDNATFEVDLQYAGGENTAYHWTHRAIKSPQGDIMEYQAVGHDVSTQKAAESALIEAKEAAESADRAKSEFLAVVSHEIRTPINAILGFAKLLRETNLTDDQGEYVSNIHHSGITLETLIADILDLSRLEAGKIEVSQSPFALRDCLNDIYGHFMPIARKNGLEFDLKIDPNVPVIVNGDQGRMRQVLLNLMGNAIKFTEKGGVTTTVTCSRGADVPHTDLREIRLFFAITDTGIGIPEDRTAELFKPFSQIDSSTTRRRGGTGLGLVISKRLCELMGGAISVESIPNSGSTFRFSLALHYQKGDSQPPLAHVNPSPRLSPSPA